MQLFHSLASSADADSFGAGFASPHGSHPNVKLLVQVQSFSRVHAERQMFQAFLSRG